MEQLTRLPDHKVKEVSDFAEFLLSKVDDQLLTEGIQSLVSEGDAFRFLDDEPDIYSVQDLKEQYK